MQVDVPDTLQAAHWRVELLGQVRACSGDRIITQFGSRRVAALLARLAVQPGRAYGREELIDLLWPDAELDVGRNRLRQALSTLRRLLEPPGAPEVLRVDRVSASLLPAHVTSDVALFDALCRQQAAPQALAVYLGEFMPGHVDEWIEDERRRLAVAQERMAALQDARGVAVAPDKRPPGPSPATTGPTIAGDPAPAAALERRAQVFVPTPLSRFFGRHAEIEALWRMFDERRLVTVLGPGGSGKTRLAIEAAHRIAGAFERVVFVPLAECLRGDEIAARVRAALHVPAGTGDDDATLARLLGDRPLLLVLDNLEQLVTEGGPEWVERWLQRLPALRVLGTSRRPLDLDGEACFPLDPLPLPDPREGLVACAAVPSVALFVDRAGLMRPGFALHPGNLEDIAGLCAELEGVPLAIELAASRAHAMSVSRMREQLRERARERGTLFARSGPRAARDPRHASLDAALDWSWRMLAPHEQSCLAQASVFRGGWTAAAAADVWGRDDADDVLARLVADSLVQTREGTGAGLRHQMYEMVREFSAARLAPEQALAARDRHRRWVHATAERGKGTVPADEIANLEQALVSALEDGRAREGLQLCLASEQHWERQGVSPQVSEVWRGLLEQAMRESPPTDPLLHAARALFIRRVHDAGDVATAEAWIAQSVSDARGDPRLELRARAQQLRISWKSTMRETPALMPELEGLIERAEALDDETTLADLHNLVGQILVLGRKRPAEALPHYQRARALYSALGETRRALDVRLGEGLCAQARRDFDEALAIHAEVAWAARGVDDPLLLADAINNLGVASSLSRRWHDAVRYGVQQLELATRQHSHYMQCLALWNLARPMGRARLAEQAAQMLAFVVAEWQRHFGPLIEADWRYVARVRGLLRAQLGRARTAQLWRQGEALSLDEVLEQMRRLPG